MSCIIGVADKHLADRDGPEEKALRSGKLIFDQRNQSKKQKIFAKAMYLAFAFGNTIESEEACNNEFQCPMSGYQVAEMFTQKYATLVQ